jgi:hypothetical protein
MTKLDQSMQRFLIRCMSFLKDALENQLYQPTQSQPHAQVVRRFFSVERSLALCQQAISRAIVLTESDLVDWSENPEEFAREYDVSEWRFDVRACAERIYQVPSSRRQNFRVSEKLEEIYKKGCIDRIQRRYYRHSQTNRKREHCICVSIGERPEAAQDLLSASAELVPHVFQFVTQMMSFAEQQPHSQSVIIKVLLFLSFLSVVIGACMCVCPRSCLSLAPRTRITSSCYQSLSSLSLFFSLAPSSRIQDMTLNQRQDACFRALGLGYNTFFDMLDFASWFSRDLHPILAAPPSPSTPLIRVLQRRIAWVRFSRALSCYTFLCLSLFV